MCELPSITIGIPVLNEEQDIERCLKSIKEQNYPADKVEVIVVDGGSTDNTEDIVLKFGYKFINNPDRKAEPGMALACKNAQGELFVNFAADNAMREKDWLQKMTLPFLENEKVIGALCRVECDNTDDPFLKYFNSNTDPFSAFFYGNASHPEKYPKAYPISKETEDYVIYKFDSVNYPLIAFAQGFTIRTSYERPEETAFDDVLPIIRIIDEGHDIAYVKTATLAHYVFKNFSHYRKRMLRKVSESFTDKGHGFHVRESHMSTSRKVRQYLFVLWGLTLIGPFASALQKAVKRGEMHFFYEVPASFLLALYIVYMFIVVRVLKTRTEPIKKYY